MSHDVTTPEGQAALIALCDAATPGPWEAERWDLNSGALNWHIKAPESAAFIGTTQPDLDHPRAKQDAELIVASIEALPAAIEEIRRLTVQRDRFAARLRQNIATAITDTE